MENLFNLDLFGRISSSCFLYDNNNICISINLENTPILISNLEGNIIKSLKDIEDNSKEFDDVVYFSDSYYDKKLNKSFIIFGKKGYS